MSIEQKITEMLAESKNKQAELVEEVEEYDDEVVEELEEVTEDAADDVVAEEVEELDEVSLDKASGAYAARVDKLNKSKFGTNKFDDNNMKASDTLDRISKKHGDDGKKAAVKKAGGHDVSEDVEALVNGEDLSEEFKTKAATIFEAAIVNRVKAEVAKLEEEFEAKLEEAAAQNQEGLVEKVDGYLNYVVETWIAQNEIALERGMKSEILENFVSGLKGLFEENYIDIPEEKFDVVGQMEETIEELQAKLDEQLAANVEMNKVIAEQARVDIIKDACNGLTDTEVEKFTGLAEELAFEDEESFATKVQTIRENYFTNKAGKTLVESVVTDTPVESLTEEKVIDPSMKRYMNALNNVK